MFGILAAPVDRSQVAIAGWELGSLVPGTARQFSLVSPPSLAPGWFSYLIWFALRSSMGSATHFLSAIAIPNVSNLYGIGVPVSPALEVGVRQSWHLWLVLCVVNLVAVIGLEGFRPRFAGPRGLGSPTEGAATF